MFAAPIHHPWSNSGLPESEHAFVSDESDVVLTYTPVSSDNGQYDGFNLYYETYSGSTLLQTCLNAGHEFSAYDYDASFGPSYMQPAVNYQPYAVGLHEEPAMEDGYTASYTPTTASYTPTPSPVEFTPSAPAQPDLVNNLAYDLFEGDNSQEFSAFVQYEQFIESLDATYEQFIESSDATYDVAASAADTLEYNASAKQNKSRRGPAGAALQLEEPHAYKLEAPDRSPVGHDQYEQDYLQGYAMLPLLESVHLEAHVPFPPATAPSQAPGEPPYTKHEAKNAALPMIMPERQRALKPRTSGTLHAAQVPYPVQTSIATLSTSAQASAVNLSLLQSTAATGLGRVMYSPASMEPLSASILGPIPTSFARPKRKFKRGTAVACLFCRRRKIACGGPVAGGTGKTCIQCARRNQDCEYPSTSSCTSIVKEVPDTTNRMIHITPEDP